MLKKLQKKLVTITLFLMGIILFGTLTFNYAAMQNSVNVIIAENLQETLNAPEVFNASQTNTVQRHENRTAYSNNSQAINNFWIEIAHDGRIVAASTNLYPFDAQTLSDIILDVQKTPNTIGQEKKFHLAWQKQMHGDNLRIAFVSRKGFDEALFNQLIVDIALGCSALGLLFCIIKMLARIAIRPIAKNWRQQKVFIANASHELKTPLSVILANMTILRSHLQKHFEQNPEDIQKANQEALKWVDITTTEATNMKNLIEDMLELARNEESYVKISNMDMTSINLSELIDSASLEFDAYAFENNCVIDTKIEPGIYVTGDEKELRRLFETLIENACKYALYGSHITVSLKAVQHNKRVLFAVNNMGKEPIDPQELPHLFDRFYRTDKARNRETGGVGLGLAIAKSIVEAHDGEIDATSDSIEGTTFNVSLKIEHKDTPPPAKSLLKA